MTDIVERAVRELNAYDRVAQATSLGLIDEVTRLRNELSDTRIKLDNTQVGAEHIYQENEQLRDELDEIKYDKSTRIEFAARVLEDHDMLEVADRLRSLIAPQLEDERWTRIGTAKRSKLFIGRIPKPNRGGIWLPGTTVVSFG